MRGLIISRYIVVNRQYTGDLKGLWNVLPWRRKVTGRAPGMTGKQMNAKEDDPEFQWVYPKAEPTAWQKKQIVARVAEIVVRVMFEHFSYRFAGDA